MPTIIHNEQVLVDIEEDIDTVIKEVGDIVFERVVGRTPVRTGYAQSRWQIEHQPTGFELSNDAEYISYLEEGSSQQAPAGMLGITLLEVPDITEEVVRRHQRNV